MRWASWGCVVCAEGKAEAEKLDAYWVELCESLGVTLNLQKREHCAQSVSHAGFTFDTLRG